MYRDSGIILKIIPYSDSASIVRCFTRERGLLPFFVRHPKKHKYSGHIQTGAFIEFTAQRKPGSMASLKDNKWDARIPNTPLHPAMLATWLFTIELLHKSLAEEFPLAVLKTKIENYYAHLLHEAISANPCVPLIVISNTLGLINFAHLEPTLDSRTRKDLVTLGYTLSSDRAADAGSFEGLFETELSRFTEHFNIRQLESLQLL